MWFPFPTSTLITSGKRKQLNNYFCFPNAMQVVSREVMPILDVISEMSRIGIPIFDVNVGHFEE